MQANQVRPASYRLDWAATSHAGPRPVNEDRVYVDEARGWFTVIDGIGGPGKGDVAADLVLSCLTEAQSPQAALREANARILDGVREAPEAKGMGATVSLAVIGDDQAEIYHVGETRIYLVREGRLSQLTEDHTLASQLVKLKQIRPEEASTHPARKSILRYLGKDETPKLEPQVVPIAPGDVLILCSDGLYAGLPEEALLALAHGSAGLPQRLEGAVAECLASDALDNISAVLIRIPAAADSQPAGPGSVSRRLRALVDSLLASPSPADDLTAILDDLLGLVVATSGAASGLLVLEAGGERRIAGVTGEPTVAPRELLSESQDAITEALAASRPVQRGQDVVLPVVDSGLVFCLRLASGTRLDQAALEPYLELAAWYGPLSRIVALKGDGPLS